jgi:hypothetical protein
MKNAMIRRDFENWQWPLRILKSKEVLDELNNCEQLKDILNFGANEVRLR